MPSWFRANRNSRLNLENQSKSTRSSVRSLRTLSIQRGLSMSGDNVLIRLTDSLLSMDEVMKFVEDDSVGAISTFVGAFNIARN